MRTEGLWSEGKAGTLVAKLSADAEKTQGQGEGCPLVTALSAKADEEGREDGGRLWLGGPWLLQTPSSLVLGPP